jgi:hypothetical protein
MVRLQPGIGKGRSETNVRHDSKMNTAGRRLGDDVSDVIERS